MTRRVLVVDDDRALQTLLNVILTRASFEVEFASSGRQALEKLNADGEFNAVLLDLILPEINGIEIPNQLRREKPELPTHHRADQRRPRNDRSSRRLRGSRRHSEAVRHSGCRSSDGSLRIGMSFAFNEKSFDEDRSQSERR